MMMRILLTFLMMLPLCSVAQTKYCTSWQDFLDSQWKETEGRVELKSSSKEDALAMEVKAEKKKTSYLIRKTACVVEYEDSLYLNLRPFNTFGDVYVRAWRLGDKLLFARQDVAPSGFSVTFGGNVSPLSRKSFRTLSRLENLVCYLAAWDPQREELRMARVTESVVQQLLTNHPDQLSRYQSVERKKRENADVIISLLRAAGVISFLPALLQ
ncbi:MAG: hypothetical protein IJ069_00410 [Prevotella sp.]|nr:hypothetical protein [Prevotella sp.]